MCVVNMVFFQNPTGPTAIQRQMENIGVRESNLYGGALSIH